MDALYGHRSRLKLGLQLYALAMKDELEPPEIGGIVPVVEAADEKPKMRAPYEKTVSDERS